MSNFYPFSAYHVDHKAIPHHVAAENVWDVLEQKSLAPAPGSELYGGTRRGWLNRVFINIAAKYDIAPLHFLYREPWDGDYYLLLRPEDLLAVATSLRFLLSRFESHPGEFNGLDDDSPWDAEDILHYLQAAKPSLNPQADDGDGPNYFFAFVKSMLAFCEAALANEQAVWFFQLCEG